jgi:HAD superfamily hydrolase (TIGR01509 family)
LRFDAAIFDFDETMVNLERQHDDASHALCRELGSNYLEMPHEFRHSSGRRVVDDVAEMIRFFRWTRSLDDLYERRQALFLEECRRSEIEPLPGVLETVEELHSRGLRLAIASSGIPASIEEILQRFGIRDRFQVIVAGDQVRRGKPDPEIYLTTASRLNALPERCVVFEDSEVGVRAAKAAGMYCIAVRNPRATIRQDLSAADREVASFTEVDL